MNLIKKEYGSITKTEEYLQVLICFIIGFSIIQGGVLTLLRSFVVLPFKLDVVAAYALYMVVVLYTIKTVFNRIKDDTRVLLLVLSLGYLISLLIEYQDYSLQMGAELLIGFIIYAVTRALRRYDNLTKFLNITSILITLSVIIVFLLFPSQETTMNSYSQTFGYAIFPAVIISFNAFMNNRSMLYLLNFAVAFVLVTIAGARGPFIISIFFVLIRFFQGYKNFGSKKKTWSILFVLSIFAFMVVVSMSKVEKIITEYSFQDGNRLIEMLKNDDLLEDDARNSLKSISISLIKDHPFGMGIGQERKSLQERKALSNAQDDAVGNYSHNFFLEIMLNYGIIIGVVISALLVYLIFINFFKNKNETTKNIWLMFFSFGFLPLMFSGSYTNWPWFWLFLGVSVNIFYENKLVRKN